MQKSITKFAFLMSMCKKNLKAFKQVIWPKKTIKKDLKKNEKVAFLGVLILYRCASRPIPFLQYTCIKSYVASYNLKDQHFQSVI